MIEQGLQNYSGNCIKVKNLIIFIILFSITKSSLIFNYFEETTFLFKVLFTNFCKY